MAYEAELKQRIDAHNEGTKYDYDKPRYDLLPVEALEQAVLVYTFGATKYSAHNWRKGITYSRLYSALQRHISAFWRGENLDPETGLSHLAHATFNVLALLQFQLEGRSNLDDRYKRTDFDWGFFVEPLRSEVYRTPAPEPQRTCGPEQEGTLAPAGEAEGVLAQRIIRAVEDAPTKLPEQVPPISQPSDPNGSRP